jgi:hypothetical protein
LITYISAHILNIHTYGNPFMAWKFSYLITIIDVVSFIFLNYLIELYIDLIWLKCVIMKYSPHSFINYKIKGLTGWLPKYVKPNLWQFLFNLTLACQIFSIANSSHKPSRPYLV